MPYKIFRIVPGIGSKKNKKWRKLQIPRDHRISSHQHTKCLGWTLSSVCRQIPYMQSSIPYSLASPRWSSSWGYFQWTLRFVTDYSSERFPRLDWCPELMDQGEPVRVVWELRPHSVKGTVLLNRAEVCFHLRVSVKISPQHVSTAPVSPQGIRMTTKASSRCKEMQSASSPGYVHNKLSTQVFFFLFFLFFLNHRYFSGINYLYTPPPTAAHAVWP